MWNQGHLKKLNLTLGMIVAAGTIIIIITTITTITTARPSFEKVRK